MHLPGMSGSTDVLTRFKLRYIAKHSCVSIGLYVVCKEDRLFLGFFSIPGYSPPMPTGSARSLLASHGVYLLGWCLSEPIARDGFKGELLGNVWHHNLVF